jgi:hypothetical protein
MIPPHAILTASGVYFDLAAPESAPVDVVDIAHALAHQCRFTGHTRRFYSVAEHSIHCSHLVPPEDALAALMHDAAEAYIGDVSKPLKSMLPDYRALEKRIEAAVFAHFGLPAVLPESVKRADIEMLKAEEVLLMVNFVDERTMGMPVPSVTLRFWSPTVAKVKFLRRYMQLRGKR